MRRKPKPFDPPDIGKLVELKAAIAVVGGRTYSAGTVFRFVGRVGGRLRRRGLAWLCDRNSTRLVRTGIVRLADIVLLPEDRQEVIR